MARMRKKKNSQRWDDFFIVVNGCGEIWTGREFRRGGPKQVEPYARFATWESANAVAQKLQRLSRCSVIVQYIPDSRKDGEFLRKLRKKARRH